MKKIDPCNLTRGIANDKRNKVKKYFLFKVVFLFIFCKRIKKIKKENFSCKLGKKNISVVYGYIKKISNELR